MKKMTGWTERNIQRYINELYNCSALVSVFSGEWGRYRVMNLLDVGESIARQVIDHIRSFSAYDILMEFYGLGAEQESEIVYEDVEPEEPEWIIGNTFATVYKSDSVYTVDKSHPQFANVTAAILAGDFDKAISLMNTKEAVLAFSQGHVSIEGDKLFYHGYEIHGSIVDRILSAMREGREFGHLVNFFELLMDNPSAESVADLFDFMQHNDLEIDDDGYVIAWRRVTDDYKDFYTGEVDNSIGAKPWMPRHMVNDDNTVTCSHGYHLAARSYIPHYSGGQGRVIKCRANPADFVAVPKDYKNAKARVCSYEVLEDVTHMFVSNGFYG